MAQGSTTGEAPASESERGAAQVKVVANPRLGVSPMTLLSAILSAAVFIACVGVLATPRLPRRWLIQSVSGPKVRQIVEARTQEDALACSGLDPDDARLRCDPLD